MLLLGLDLAWGKINTSGGVALHAEPGGPARVLDVQEQLGDDDDLLRWVEKWDGAYGHGGLLLGIDAPLLVPNITGKRPCETEIGRRFARFQAGAHPANRTIFGGDVRGERLVYRLAERGIVHNPYLSAARDARARQVMEVFPHPAHVVLFGLGRTLKYKAKPGRDAASRGEAFAAYTRHLRSLTSLLPPLILPPDWPPADVTHLRGAALKRLEDGMDALTCAYIVYYYWWHGVAGGEVIGDMTDGSIVVPRPPDTNDAAAVSQRAEGDDT